jgi:hypothetical protein
MESFLGALDSPPPPLLILITTKILVIKFTTSISAAPDSLFRASLTYQGIDFSGKVVCLHRLEFRVVLAFGKNEVHLCRIIFVTTEGTRSK